MEALDFAEETIIKEKETKLGDGHYSTHILEPVLANPIF